MHLNSVEVKLMMRLFLIQNCQLFYRFKSYKCEHTLFLKASLSLVTVKIDFIIYITILIHCKWTTIQTLKVLLMNEDK